MDSSAEKRILQSMRYLFEAVVGKMIKTFPLSNPILQDMEILDPEKRLSLSTQQCTRMALAFPQLDLDVDTVGEEFQEYKILADNELPEKEEIDKFWGHMALKTALGKPVFPNLCKLMTT